MYPLSFDHIHYKSQDFNKTKEFYIQVMGAEDLGYIELGPEGKRSPNLQLSLGGAMLLFAEDSGVSTAPTEECGFPCNVPPWNTRHGVYHIALLVADCDAATEYFREKGKEVYGADVNIVAMEPFIAGVNIRASFLSAPDGMAIELKQNL